jgi:hypothetical protein
MTRILLSAVLFLIVMLSNAFPDTLPVADSTKIVLPLGLTPLYESPVSGGLPLSYLESADTCRIDSTRFDTANIEWVFARGQSRSGWLQKSSVRLAYLPPSAPQSKSFILDADAKRRYRIIAQHPDWERRIVKVVREGKICLDMNDEQVLASWGEPLQKGAAFILGAGKQNVWLYKSPGGRFETVFLVKGRVVGWSE